MKKTLAIVALLALCTSAFASDISVKSGDKKVFKNHSGKAILEFIWDGATYDESMPLEQKLENLEELKPYAWEGFVENFNEKCKTVKVTDNPEEANLKITMQVTNMDQYVKVMGWIPAPATKAWGILTITDLETGEVLVTIEVDEVDGGANPSPTGTFSDCFEELGSQVAGLK